MKYPGGPKSCFIEETSLLLVKSLEMVNYAWIWAFGDLESMFRQTGSGIILLLDFVKLDSMWTVSMPAKV